MSFRSTEDTVYNEYDILLSQVDESDYSDISNPEIEEVDTLISSSGEDNTSSSDRI